MRLGCFLPLLAVGLIAMGAQGVYVGVTNRRPNVMTYQEFLQKKPSSGWIEISDARLNLLSAISQSNRFTGTIKQVYIPVESSTEGEGGGDGPIHLLLSTKDEAILQTMKDLQAVTGGGGLFGKLERRVEANAKRAANAKAQTKMPEPAADAGIQNTMRFMARKRREACHHPAGSRSDPVRSRLRPRRPDQDQGAGPQDRPGFCRFGRRGTAAVRRLRAHGYRRTRTGPTADRPSRGESRIIDPAGRP